MSSADYIMKAGTYTYSVRQDRKWDISIYII